MNKGKISKLYEQAHRVYEIPYESSVVDPTIVSVHIQKVWDRDLFARLIVQECLIMADQFEIEVNKSGLVDRMKQHFGFEE